MKQKYKHLKKLCILIYIAQRWYCIYVINVKKFLIKNQII